MAEEQLGVGFQIHGGGNDLVFPHHENEAAQTRMARDGELAQIWMHNGMLQFGEEKMAKSVGNVMALHEVLDDVGRNALIMLFVGAHYRQPMAFDDMRLMEALARVARVRDAARGLVDGESPADMRSYRDAFFEALAQDFNTPAALAAMFDWIKEANRRSDEPVGRADLVEMLAVLGLQNLAEHGSEAGAEEQELLEARQAARAAKDYAEADRLRDELRHRGWEVRDGARRAGARAHRAVILYGRNPVREALRAGRRTFGEIWATERVIAREPWLSAGRARGSRAPRRSSAAPSPPTTRASAPRPAATPTCPAQELLMRDDPFIVALDELQDPQNLGAIARSAECAGVTGLVICERRAAAVTPAVVKASAGAIEHLRVARVRNMADFLGEAKEAGAWCYGADGGGDTAYDAPDYTGGVVLVMGAEGSGLRPRVAKSCDALVALPLRGRTESLNASAAAAVLMYEILQRRSAA